MISPSSLMMQEAKSRRGCTRSRWLLDGWARNCGAEGGTASPSRVGTYARASPAREAWEGHASRVLDRARAAEGPTCTSYINDGDVGKPVGLGYRTCRCTR